MKKIRIFLLLTLVTTCFWSCQEEKLGPSVIQDSDAEFTEMDKWLYDNLTVPYNINVMYKLKDIQTNTDYNVVPATPSKCLALAKVVKYLWASTYDEYLGADFLRAASFRELQFEGTYQYSSSAIYKATASAGIKVTLCGINSLTLSNLKDPNYVSDEYLKTMFHEHTHILNQKKPYPASFGNVCGPDYLGDDYGTRSDTSAYKLGFITPYAGSSAGEDMAEMVSIYVTKKAYWETVMKWESPNVESSGGKTDVAKLNEKLSIVREYMKNSWNIDLDELRALYEARQANLANLDLSF